MKHEVLVVTPLYGPTLQALEREYTVHRLWEAQDRDALLAAIRDRVRAGVTTGLVGFEKGLIDALPKLELIGCFGVGHGTLALEAARARDIVVTNTPDSSADSVADLAMGLLLAVLRRICEGDRYVREGKWAESPFRLGTKIGGKTCGIVGLGSIGKRIATRAAAFDMKICYYGPRRKDDVPYPYYSDLRAMASACDCLVIACPGTEQTLHLIDAKILDALGPQGVLINIGRGSVVDEDALIAALREKRLGGAGLDVYKDEPHVPVALRAMENVVLLAHMGTSTKEIREERGELLLANLRAHFAGAPVLTPLR